ncbi:MAG: maleylpyruvate isomerase family mycothiol-dependent enzyme [Nocardioides sp.]
MSRLSASQYLSAIESESARFREVLADANPTAPVPSCPAWSALDLANHLAGVQAQWAWVVANRPKNPEERPETDAAPTTYDAALTAVDEASAGLVAALRDADPADPAWTWSKEQTVGFILRRQAHEALIHRLDAELTALGHFGDLDPALASDGVAEVLDVMFGGLPEWGEFSPLPHYIRVELTDTGQNVWVQLGRFSGTDPSDHTHYDEDDIRVVADPGIEPDAVISSPAGIMNARLWRRGDGDSIHLAGDLEIVDHFRRVIHQPIS